MRQNRNLMEKQGELRDQDQHKPQLMGRRCDRMGNLPRPLDDLGDEADRKKEIVRPAQTILQEVVQPPRGPSKLENHRGLPSLATKPTARTAKAVFLIPEAR